MAIKTFTVGEVLTASDTNTYLANAGLVYVASKTWTSTSSAQQIDNCFTSTYDQYVIRVNTLGDQATPVTIWARLVDGTTPVTSANYYSMNVFNSTAAGPTRYWTPSGTAWPVGYVGNNTGNVFIDLNNPQVATYTSGTLSYLGNGTSDYYSGTESIFWNSTAQYEGIQFYPNSGNWSGSITIMGVRKA